MAMEDIVVAGLGPALMLFVRFGKSVRGVRRRSGVRDGGLFLFRVE